MTIVLVFAGLVLSSVLTWAVLALSRRFMAWRLRRCEMAADPAMKGIPKVLDARSNRRLEPWPRVAASMQRRSVDGVHWAESELVLVRKEDETFILDCLVFARLGDRHEPLGVPMTLRGQSAEAGPAPDNVLATLVSWVEEGAAVDISVGAQHGAAFVTLASDSCAVALKIDEVARPR